MGAMFHVLCDLKEAKDLLKKAAELLGEVRTGEDFECECWEQKDKIEKFLKRINEEV